MFGGGVRRLAERWWCEPTGSVLRNPRSAAVVHTYTYVDIYLLHCLQKSLCCSAVNNSALELPAHAQFQHGFALSEPFHQRHRRLSRNCDKRAGFPSRMFSVVFQFSNAVVFLQRLWCSPRLDGSRQLSYDIHPEDRLSPHIDSILGHRQHFFFGIIHDLVAIPSSEIWPLLQ